MWLGLTGRLSLYLEKNTSSQNRTFLGYHKHETEVKSPQAGLCHENVIGSSESKLMWEPKNREVAAKNSISLE